MASGVSWGIWGGWTFNISTTSNQPTVRFANSGYTFDENAGTVSATVSLSSSTSQAVSVPYTFSNGSATNGSDYTSTNGTLTIPAGQTAGSVSFSISDDSTVESNETFTISLGSPTNATLGIPNQTTVTILDNDVPAGDEYEPDNTAAQATAIDSGVSQTHSIVPAADVDWVRFTLSASSAVHLETTGATAADTRLWLYDSTLTELEFDDDDGAGFYSLIDRTCGGNALPAGTYYVKVDEYLNDGQIVAYTLSYSVTQTCALPVPEMDVQYDANGVSIADEDTTPTPFDGTDFGGADVTSGSVSHWLRVWNTGTADLQLTGTPRVVISGTDAADFTVTAQPGTPIGAGGNSAQFEVIFNPSAAGLRTATISIANNDSDENPYNFTIQGTGTAVELRIPTNVQASDGIYPDRVCISWDADGGIGHVISRANTLAGSKTILNPSDLPSFSFCDTTITPGQTYYYWVQACSDHSTCSAYSNYDTGYAEAPSYKTYLPAIVK